MSSTVRPKVRWSKVLQSWFVDCACREGILVKRGWGDRDDAFTVNNITLVHTSTTQHRAYERRISSTGGEEER